MTERRTVLVVEDDPKIAQLLLDYLRHEGYEAHAIADGQLALAHIEATPPALILLDLMLPGLDGIGVCRSVRQFSDVPILMLTARIDEGFRMLRLLLSRPGRVFARAQLLDSVHADLRDVSDRAIDSHVKNLRRKIEAVEPGCNCIASDYGAGYRFDAPA